MEPMVRAVVLNYNGGDAVVACVESLLTLDWPEGRLDIVVVDNASTDGSPEAIAETFPTVRLIRNGHNDGFSANNLGIHADGPWDHLALVNPDAYVSPRWLRALIGAMDDATVGAVTPKMLLASRFTAVDIGVADEAAGVVAVRTVAVDGEDVTGAARRASRLLVDAAIDLDALAPGQAVSLPVPLPGDQPTRLDLVLDAPTSTSVTVGTERQRVGPGSTTIAITGDAITPTYDVVNNSGITVTADFYGADRDLGIIDGPEATTAGDVFGWSGGGALLRRAYLDDVGDFDPRFFLYYEDFDLSWRGLARGWRHVHCPDAVMHHHHALSTDAGSDLFVVQNERNRLLALAKNAPARIAVRSWIRFCISTVGYARAEILVPLSRRRAPQWRMVRLRLRVVVALVRIAPAIVRSRRATQRNRRVPHAAITRWAGVPTDGPAATGRTDSADGPPPW